MNAPSVSRPFVDFAIRCAFPPDADNLAVEFSLQPFAGAEQIIAVPVIQSFLVVGDERDDCTFKEPTLLPTHRQHRRDLENHADMLGEVAFEDGVLAWTKGRAPSGDMRQTNSTASRRSSPPRIKGLREQGSPRYARTGGGRLDLARRPP